MTVGKVESVRPTTGHLLVGGDFYKHVGYGIHNSWLSSDDPEGHLFSKQDFSQDEASLGGRFVLPAMESKFPDFLLDVPMARDNGAIKRSQEITVLFLPEGQPWQNATVITKLSYEEDLEVVEESDGKTLRLWRSWSDEWFRERVRETLISSLTEKRKEIVRLMLEESLLARPLEALEVLGL